MLLAAGGAVVTTPHPMAMAEANPCALDSPPPPPLPPVVVPLLPPPPKVVVAVVEVDSLVLPSGGLSKLATAFTTSSHGTYTPSLVMEVIRAAVAVAIASICAAAVPAMMGAPSEYRVAGLPLLLLLLLWMNVEEDGE